MQAALGESPVWEARTATLYFVDISGGKLHALDATGRLDTLYSSRAPLCALALTESGKLLLAEGAQVALFDPGTRRIERTSRPVSLAPSQRFNDGACDPQGRFVSGLMDEHHASESGRIYRFESDFSATPLNEGMGLPNGLAWSRDGERLYFVDSIARRILQAPYSPDIGALGRVDTFVDTSAHPGRPDGMAMDEEGGLWVCQFGGACLLRFNGCGELTDRLSMPVLRPTSACFGGADMRTLFVTSARFGMSNDELARYSASGDVFTVRLPVAGLPRYRGSIA
ncbi:SMP-30/gluconolactonase/LRE family protein [Halomonas sp. HMF6819]|uniref:SMP-30/gluconolactonase/LRE family protein n=1 Tax=Halomonas sp. HMF6819 TaxID=3373085 RepID=UPI003797164C